MESIKVNVLLKSVVGFINFIMLICLVLYPVSVNFIYITIVLFTLLFNFLYYFVLKNNIKGTKVFLGVVGSSFLGLFLFVFSFYQSAKHDFMLAQLIPFLFGGIILLSVLFIIGGLKTLGDFKNKSGLPPNKMTSKNQLKRFFIGVFLWTLILIVFRFSVYQTPFQPVEKSDNIFSYTFGQKTQSGINLYDEIQKITFSEYGEIRYLKEAISDCLYQNNCYGDIYKYQQFFSDYQSGKKIDFLNISKNKVTQNEQELIQELFLENKFLMYELKTKPTKIDDVLVSLSQSDYYQFNPYEEGSYTPFIQLLRESKYRIYYYFENGQYDRGIQLLKSYSQIYEILSQGEYGWIDGLVGLTILNIQLEITENILNNYQLPNSKKIAIKRLVATNIDDNYFIMPSRHEYFLLKKELNELKKYESSFLNIKKIDILLQRNILWQIQNNGQNSPAVQEYFDDFSIFKDNILGKAKYEFISIGERSIHYNKITKINQKKQELLKK